MNLLSIVLLAFVLLECSNVIILYFFPQTQKGNGLGTFKAFEQSKRTPKLMNLLVTL